MSVRVVVSVALAVGICALAFPAIEDARTTRADHHATSELASVERAMTDLTTEDAVPLGDPGARRVVALDAPSPSPTIARVAFVAVGGVPDEQHAKDAYGDVLAARVEGGKTRVRHVPFEIRVARRDSGGELRVLSDSEALVSRSAGKQRLVLRLVKRRGRPVILVSRFDSPP